MQRTIYISGASDDLVEVAGDVSLEADVYGEERTIVVVNGHDLLKVTYGDGGQWGVELISEQPGLRVQLVPSLGEAFERSPAPPFGIVSYSDYAIVTGAITSVEVGAESWNAPA